MATESGQLEFSGIVMSFWSVVYAVRRNGRANVDDNVDCEVERVMLWRGESEIMW